MNKICILDSRKRDSITLSKSNNFRILLDYPIERVKKVRLVSSFIPHTIYNIDSSNNSWRISITGNGVYDLFISVGSYSATNLVQQFQDELNILSPAVFTVSYSSVSLRLSIQSNISFELQLINSTLAQLLGFNKLTYPFTNSITGENAVNLSIPLINIWVNEFGIDCIGKGEFNTFVIPINCLPNQLISYEKILLLNKKSVFIH